jgi:hypothetical protein
LLRGTAHAGVGRVVDVHAEDRAWACAIYAARFPDVPAGHDPFVVITCQPG